MYQFTKKLTLLGGGEDPDRLSPGSLNYKYATVSVKVWHAGYLVKKNEKENRINERKSDKFDWLIIDTIGDCLTVFIGPKTTNNIT